MDEPRLDAIVVVPEWFLSWPVRLVILFAVIAAAYLVVRVMLGAKIPPDFPNQTPTVPAA